MKPKIILPNKIGAGANETIDNDNNIVIIGANGAGKTRLGAWIERTLVNTVTVHRISAQRVLNIPNYAAVKTLEQAEKNLLFGREDQYALPNYKWGTRWGDDPEIFMLDDFDKLLSTLFARTTKRDREHSTETKEKQVYVPVPDAPIDTMISLWNDIMPQRIIKFEDGKVTAAKIGEQEYHGKQMSDGERVALYLIGQCLCAPENSIIIIDEPEIHLHKSLMSRLWDKIEEVCPTKLLVYITHDLDFASSRKEANKLWIKNYNGNASWLWDFIPEVGEIPENLTIEIVGNRKNIIFSEGEKGGLDLLLYQMIYEGYHIVPRGNCEKVIESTKAMRATPSLHHLIAFGLIDSDYRTQEEIDILNKAGVLTLNVAEIENLFCVEPLIRIVASHLHLDPDQKVAEVTAFIIQALKDEYDVQITNRAEREIQFRLNSYTKEAHNEKGLHDGLVTSLGKINVAAIYQASKKIYDDAINQNNLGLALHIYNRKSLSKRVAGIFGLRDGEYVNIILRLLKSSRKEELLSTLRPLMPLLV